MPPKGSRAGPRYNNISILRGIDLTDFPSLRLLLSAFHTYITSSSILATSTTELTDTLPLPHRAVFHRIISSIHLNSTNYPLLRDAMLKLSEAHDKSDAHFKKAIRGIEELGEEKVIFNPGVHWEEYDAALRRWEEGEEYALNSNGEVMGKEKEEEVVEKKETPKKGRGRPRGSGAKKLVAGEEGFGDSEEEIVEETPKKGRGKPKGSATEKKMMVGDEIIKDSEAEDTDLFFVESPDEKAKGKGRKSNNATPEKKGKDKNMTNNTPEKKRKPIMIAEEIDFTIQSTGLSTPSLKGKVQESNGKKRKACQQCSDGHLRCDKEEPICGNCTKARKDCVKVYREKRQKGSPGSSVKKKYTRGICEQVLVGHEVLL